MLFATSRFIYLFIFIAWLRSHIKFQLQPGFIYLFNQVWRFCGDL